MRHRREMASRAHVVGVSNDGSGENPQVATESLEDFLGLDVDCATDFAALSGRDINEAIDQLCAILAIGKNIVAPLPKQPRPKLAPPRLSRTPDPSNCRHDRSCQESAVRAQQGGELAISGVIQAGLLVAILA
jgi:hypothetical protein